MSQRKRFYPSTPKEKQNSGPERVRPTQSLAEVEPKTKEEAVFNLLMERLDQMQTQQVLMAQILGSLQTEQSAQRAAFERELLAEKQRSTEAIRAAMQAIESRLDTKQVTPEQKEALTQQAYKEALDMAAYKKAAFMSVLEASPRSPLYNPFEEAVPLTINGVTALIRSGNNPSVPAPFITLWEEWLEKNKRARAREKLIRGHQDFGDVERWLASGNPGHQERFLNLGA